MPHLSRVPDAVPETRQLSARYRARLTCFEISIDKKLMGRLNGKLAIITGAGQGIGLGIAQTFAEEGAVLVLSGRTLSKLKNAARELEATGAKVTIIQADARSRADADHTIAHAIEIFGGVDILINNAQTSTPGVMFEDVTDDIIADTIASGLYGTIYHMQAALPHLKVRGGGSIINFGSRQGTYGEPGYAPYAATMEAIRGLTRSTAREWGPLRIRINVINPSAMSPGALEWEKNFPEEVAQNLKLVAMRRWGRPKEDIRRVALFLASDDSTFITGQTILVEGGMDMP